VAWTLVESSQYARVGEFVLKGAARVTNVLVVSLDASCKNDCGHRDTETKASRREEHAGQLPIAKKVRRACREKSWRRAFADVATLRMKDEEVVVKDPSP